MKRSIERYTGMFIITFGRINSLLLLQHNRNASISNYKYDNMGKVQLNLKKKKKVLLHLLQVSIYILPSQMFSVLFGL